MKTLKFKRPLVLVLVLALAMSAVTGGTIAWFTDEVTSANNVIEAGNLDVEVKYWKDNSWVTVDENAELFDDDALWEPGYTEVAYLQVHNAGSLALKYKLTANVVSETESTNVYEETFKLSDHLVCKAVEIDEETVGNYSRDKAVQDAGNEIGLNVYSTDYKSLLVNDNQYVALVIYMPTTVGNEANHKTGIPAPQITLGVKLEATQLTHESDSFDNQYDASAPASLWNGLVPTEMPASLVVDGATQTVHVKDAEAFAYLSTLSDNWAKLYTDGEGTTHTNYANGAGANYYYSGQWTVSLEDNIDLGNHPIDPVNIVFGQSTGATTFNGNGHVIRNINTTTGLFENGTRASFENLVLENVKATNGALSGSSHNPIKNVTVKNAVISGDDYVGGLTGNTYSSVTGCEVIDSFVLATGKEAGGLIGYAEANSKGSTIANNVVRNTSVYANNRAAGLVAQPNGDIKVNNNTVDTVNVGVETYTDKNYKPGAVVSNDLTPSGNVNNNTVNNVFVDENSAVTIAEDTTKLQAAINNGKTKIVLGAGEFTADLYVVPANKELTITGQGAATKLNFKNQQVRLELFDKLTISNCTMGRMLDKSWGQLVFGSSTNAGSDYTLSNCIFNGEGTQGIYINQNVAATFNIENCTFNGDFGGEGAITIQNNDGVDITVNVTDCTFKNIPETSHELYMLYAYDGFKLNAEGVKAFWQTNP